MNSKIAVSFLLLTQLAGCVVVSNTNSPGDVTFNWTFGGGVCEDDADIYSVRITIPGELLENNGVYGCRNAGYPGIVLHDFAGGTYTYSIEALNDTGGVLWYSSGTFTVDGNVLENVDLTPYGQASSFGYLTWAFPSSSAATAMQSVYVSIDGGEIFVVDSDVGLSDPGQFTGYLEPGTHWVEIWAKDLDGRTHYGARGSFTTTTGTATSTHFSLTTMGSAEIEWILTAADSLCSELGIDYVFVNFVNPVTTEIVYPGEDGWENSIGVACEDSAGYQSMEFPLVPGTYDIYVSASGPATDYYSHQYPDDPYQVTVTSGAAAPLVAVQLSEPQ